MRVAVLGALGRMGTAVCEAVLADQELDLVAAVDPNSSGQLDVTGTVPILTAVEEIDPSEVDVVVDFTVAEAARSNVLWLSLIHI